MKPISFGIDGKRWERVSETDFPGGKKPPTQKKRGKKEDNNPDIWGNDPVLKGKCLGNWSHFKGNVKGNDPILKEMFRETIPF